VQLLSRNINIIPFQAEIDGTVSAGVYNGRNLLIVPGFCESAPATPTSKFNTGSGFKSGSGKPVPTQIDQFGNQLRDKV